MLINSCKISFRPFQRAIQNFRVPIRQINIAGELGKPPKLGNRNRSGFVYILGILPVATFALGTWQCYRLNWKLNLIEKLEKLVKSDPVEFPEELKEISEYTKYRVRGHFDISMKPIFIFPRQMLDTKSSNSSGGGLFSQSKSSQIGAHMIVPFIITDDLNRDRRILVNVGWVSKNIMEEVQHADFKHTSFLVSNDDIELVGVARVNEKRQPFQQKSSNKTEYLSRRNINKLSELFSTELVFLDGQGNYEFRFGDCSILPIGSQTRVQLRNEHLSYILTWYSLSGIFSYLWYAKIFRMRY